MTKQKSMLPPAVFLMGPTASGKSQIALTLAKYLPVEIISVDSAQVYRHMDIGTAKPDPITLTQVPHHLINLINPDQSYSAAQFRSDALQIMHDISSRKKIPLLTGGTMLYFKALQNGLSILPPADKDLRLKLDNMARELGWPGMHHKLFELDPKTAERLKPTDSQRIQRALEICYLTQQPMSKILEIPRETDFPYQTINIALIPGQRSLLHQRIATRFETMLCNGLIDEVQALRKKFDLSIESTSMRCVGYRQACLYLDNKITRTELHDMGIAATRQLAKRQLTWLRNMKLEMIKEFDCLSDDLVMQIQHYLQASLERHIV